MKKVLTLLLKIITPITPPIVLTIALRIYHFIFPNRTSRSVRNDELLLEIQELFPNETLAGDKSGHIATTKHDSIYRGSKYIVFEGVVCPAHNTNFRYLGYLIKNVVREGDDVLDMCAGAGAVGFPLLKESGVRSVHFADLNFQAIRSIKATISENKLDGIKCWLSDGFENIPTTEKFDLIVANPPMDGFVERVRPTPTLLHLAGIDPDFSFHRQFFLDAHNYLKKGGKICFIEDGRYSNPNFFKKILENYPHLQFEKYEWLDSIFFIILLLRKN